MKHGSLFSGIEGFGLAAEWMGWENIFHCEKNPFCQKLISHYWPDSILHDDIKTTDFRAYRGKIDIITGGDPCQPHSFAGKRAGENDERFLWPEMLRAVVESRPRWVVNENVEGSISNGTLDRKISDLEAKGYTCWPPLIIPANAVGAFHRRNRVWLVAYTERGQWEEKPHSGQTGRVGREFQPVPWNTDWQSALSKFRGVDYGLPRRVDRTDALRNAVVPQVALQIFKAIEHHERLTHRGA